jgi:hypothetical protein
MSNLQIIESGEKGIASPPSGVRNDDRVARNDTINWRESPSVQHLLDVISTIIAKEYIATAKKNPEIFNVGGVK